MGSPLDDDVDVTTQGDHTDDQGNYSLGVTTPSASPMKRLATAADREADLARKLAAARAEVTAERERHALETQRLKDDHARFVDASNVAVKDAIEARDVARVSLRKPARARVPVETNDRYTTCLVFRRFPPFGCRGSFVRLASETLALFSVSG